MIKVIDVMLWDDVNNYIHTFNQAIFHRWSWYASSAIVYGKEEFASISWAVRRFMEGLLRMNDNLSKLTLLTTFSNTFECSQTLLKVIISRWTIEVIKVRPSVICRRVLLECVSLCSDPFEEISDGSLRWLTQIVKPLISTSNLSN